MELRTINVSDILANFYQPRTKFDKDKTKELTESILGNGLVNPITVRKWKDKRYMIVSGERRWRAHKVADIKTIPCVVKEYKSDGQFMVESLIENLHRDDLSPTEKGKFAQRIMKEEGIISVNELGRRLSVNAVTLGYWMEDVRYREKTKSKADHTLIRATRGLEENEREKVIEFAEKKGIASRKMDEEFVPVYKKADEPTKKALLSGKISVEEAKKENIPEPIQLERTANDIGNDILSALHNFEHHTTELFKDNLEDLKKDNTNQLMTTCGLHMKHFMKLVNTLRQRGAKPNPLILALIKSNNGKTS